LNASVVAFSNSIAMDQVPPWLHASVVAEWGKGQLDREEFLSIPQIANNPLASRMIAIFDEDGSGTVDFQEFIAGLSAFSSKGNKGEKLRCITPPTRCLSLCALLFWPSF
jgi:Ca2+-binding EF-hand superfamily protein